MWTRRAILAPLFAQEVTFRAGVDVVNLLVSVRNGAGEWVNDLNEEDFLLSEEGTPQKISYFARQSDLPLRLGLLIDTSMSQQKVIAAERGAAFRFLDQVLRERHDLVFLIQFDTLARVRLGFSDSRVQLEEVLTGIDTPTQSELRARGGAGTSCLDAIASGAELLKTQSGRKAMIVLSDGVDSSSHHTLPMAIEAAQRADALIYAVYFTDPGFYSNAFGLPDGRAILARLARETGGAFYEVSRKQSIDRIFGWIEQELRNQYSLGYVPVSRGGYPSFRRIQLITRRKGLIVRTRVGYWPRTGSP
ncbi:MAG: VWA domain-containing protein [Acidobacteriota bacterium]